MLLNAGLGDESSSKNSSGSGSNDNWWSNGGINSQLQGGGSSVSLSFNLGIELGSGLGLLTGNWSNLVSEITEECLGSQEIRVGSLALSPGDRLPTLSSLEILCSSGSEGRLAGLDDLLLTDEGVLPGINSWCLLIGLSGIISELGQLGLDGFDSPLTVPDIGLSSGLLGHHGSGN